LPESEKVAGDNEGLTAFLFQTSSTTMGSPPKPWERGSTPAASVAAATTAASTTVGPSPAATTTTLGDSAPALPARPTSLGTTSAYSTPYSTYGANRFGSAYSPYGSYGGSYGGLYGGGGYGGMGYGGYGGGGYGGYGYGMGGMGGMGPMGMMGGPMDPNNPSLTQQLEVSTQQTFAVLQSIVQTFGGFAQMLESTFMATHSSFFAMVGVAEQLGNLRNALGTVLGLFGLLRWLKDTITGQRSRQGGMGTDFNDFLSRPPGTIPNPNAPRPSRKPIIIFLAAMFGIPYLMHRLIRSLQARLPPPPPVLDPNNLQFARAIYPFTATEGAELSLQKGDIVAILQTTDPLSGLEGEWWRGRNRAGSEGWFPKNYVEIVKRPGQDVKPEPVPQPKTVPPS
jgi:peroxin-13